MKLNTICQKVAFNALKVGDFVKHKDVFSYFYKVIDKTINGKVMLRVYSEKTGMESSDFPNPEQYMPTELHKR